MSTPYIGFGNDTLAKCPALRPGDEIHCSRCGCMHTVEGPDDGGDLLLFCRCQGKSYLVGVKGRSIVGVPSDVHGELP